MPSFEIICVVLHTDQCPPDPQETAEAYLLHQLAPAEARVFEDHYMTCGRCAGIVQETETFIGALRAAVCGAKRL